MPFTGKYNSSLHTFKCRWETLAVAFWKRYPNPMSKHVHSEDVISRELEGEKLRTKRLLFKSNRLPKFGERFVTHGSQAIVVEDSIVDPKQQKLTTYTWNVNLRRLMTVEEKCVYSASPDNKEWTHCVKESWIQSSVFGFSRPLQAFGSSRYKENSKKATRGLEYVIEKMNDTQPTATMKAFPNIKIEPQLA
ncbi:PRELI domain-containing protein 1, mitochondrial-like [Corticium candelabrum]|uniref:PRELI domain-containing protein 1, mitochondrial-like n=1 Tax=Corticium candelabrum TaxID=121492 RepID=UPI002E2773FA|nr:PRELI domain-containing protein 1, mitochondrial-like [Corticium candelabrum]